MLKYFRPKHCGSCWWIRLWPRCPIHPVKRSLNFKVKSCSLKLTKMYFYRDHILTSCSMHRQNTTLFYSPLSGRTILLTRVSLLRLSLQLSLSFHFLVSVSVSLSLSRVSRKQDRCSNLCARRVYHDAQSLHNVTRQTHTHTIPNTTHLHTFRHTAKHTRSWNYSFPRHMKCSYCSFLLPSPYQEVFTWTRGEGNEFSERL